MKLKKEYVIKKRINKFLNIDNTFGLLDNAKNIKFDSLEDAQEKCKELNLIIVDTDNKEIRCSETYNEKYGDNYAYIFYDIKIDNVSQEYEQDAKENLLSICEQYTKIEKVNKMN